jgi:hypothetical protein
VNGQDERLQHVVWDLHNRFMASPGEAYKRTLDTLATEMMNEVSYTCLLMHHMHSLACKIVEFALPIDC